MAGVTSTHDQQPDDENSKKYLNVFKMHALYLSGNRTIAIN